MASGPATSEAGYVEGLPSSGYDYGDAQVDVTTTVPYTNTYAPPTPVGGAGGYGGSLDQWQPATLSVGICNDNLHRFACKHEELCYCGRARRVPPVGGAGF